MYVSAARGSDFAVSARPPRGGRGGIADTVGSSTCRLRCFFFCVRYRQKLQVRELCTELSVGTMIYDEHILKDGCRAELIGV